MIPIQTIELPAPGIEPLLADALGEGYSFIQTLVEEWASAENRFDAPGEVLCGHLDHGLLVAVGALGIDPFTGQNDIGRIRKVYVRPAWRNKGIGRALVATLVERALAHFRCVRLRAENAEAARLYERLGFAPVADPHASHILLFSSATFRLHNPAAANTIHTICNPEVALMEDRIEKQIEIAAPVSRVWQALTDSRQFGEWFLVKMEGPFVAGQPVAGQITHPGYEHVRIQIVIQAIAPETLFSFTWHPYAVDPKMDYSHEESTLIEFRLAPTAAGTLLTVMESGFAKLPAERRAEALLRNDSGWAQQMKNIQTYVTKTS